MLGVFALSNPCVPKLGRFRGTAFSRMVEENGSDEPNVPITAIHGR